MPNRGIQAGAKPLPRAVFPSEKQSAGVAASGRSGSRRTAAGREIIIKFGTQFPANWGINGGASGAKTTVWRPDADQALGAYVRVLAVQGLEGDLHPLAADGRIERKRQDLARRKATTSPSRAGDTI